MTAANLLDMESVEEARAMFKAKFPTMSQYYFEDAEGYLDTIRDAVAHNNVHNIISPAHTLKSSSRQMGAALVSAIAKDVEAAARHQAENGLAQINVFTAMLAQLEAAFAETKAAYPTE